MEPCFECVGKWKQWRNNSLVSKSTLSKWKPVKVREQLVYFVWTAFYTGWSRTVYRLIKCVLPLKKFTILRYKVSICVYECCVAPLNRTFEIVRAEGGDCYSTFIPAPSVSRRILHPVAHLSFPITTQIMYWYTLL